MLSKDYKNRFIAEYWQTNIRYHKLEKMCEKWDKGELDFKPTCTRLTYTYQLKAMKNYLMVLEERAKEENINLFDSSSILGENVDYEKIVDEALELYKDKKLDWWSWDDFKGYLKHKLLVEHHQEIDLRSSVGKEILHYARNKWENEEW